MDGDREILRTALARHEVVDGVAHASIVLSNGLFECELPKHADPARAQQALQNLVTGACREGARHVTIELWREPGGTWEGDYTGIGGGGPLDLSKKTPRIGDAVYFSVDEAFLAQLEDLDRAYYVEERTLVSGASDDGTIRIEHSGRKMKGSVFLPEVDVIAEFDAEWCEGTASQMRMLEGTPGYRCEFQ